MKLRQILNEMSMKLYFKEYGIKNLFDLNQIIEFCNSNNIKWRQSGQSLVFNSADDKEKVIEFIESK